MKAILEFNLPEDNKEFLTATDAGGWKAVVDMVAKHLRDQLKYSDLSAESVHALTVTRELLYTALEENNLRLE